MRTKRSLAAIIAACMLLAVMAPAVAAADYPHHAQFIAYYDPDSIANATEKTNGMAGSTYVNREYSADPKAVQQVQTFQTRPIFTTSEAAKWPQFHQNAAHTGRSPSTGLPSGNSTVWSNDITAIGTMNPIIQNGYVYILTGYEGFDEPSELEEINLTCLFEMNGTVKWNHPLPRTVHYGSWSSPATDGNYVFVSSDDMHYAVDAVTGQEVWSFQSSDVNVNGGPSIGGNYVFLSDWSGHYYNLSKSDGTLQWTFDNSDTTRFEMSYSQASPAWDSSGGAIYVTGYDYSGTGPNGSGSYGYLYKVDAEGNEVWSNQSFIGQIFGGSATFDSENVYVASYNFNDNGTVYAFDKDTGILKWANVTERTDATPALANGLVYVTGGWNGGPYGSAAPGVRAYNATTGILQWSRINEDMGGWTDSVSIADGYAFVGKESGDYPSTWCYNAVYALDALTGETEWFYPQGGATAAIANGTMYTIGNNGNLYIFP